MPTELPNERALREPGAMQLDPAGEGVLVVAFSAANSCWGCFGGAAFA